MGQRCLGGTCSAALHSQHPAAVWTSVNPRLALLAVVAIPLACTIVMTLVRHFQRPVRAFGSIGAEALEAAGLAGLAWMAWLAARPGQLGQLPPGPDPPRVRQCMRPQRHCAIVCHWAQLAMDRHARAMRTRHCATRPRRGAIPGSAPGPGSQFSRIHQPLGYNPPVFSAKPTPPYS